MNNHPFGKFLYASTANITERDDQILINAHLTDWAIYPTGFGYFIYVNKDNYPNNLSKDFHNVMRLAEEQDCAYVLFDKDQPPLAGLPTHDW
jgi:hypothetical protein